jgi:hypothetical protein
MALPYISSSDLIYKTPRTSQCWVEYPFSFAGDNTTKVYHRAMVMPGDKYEPLAYNDTMTTATEKPLDSLFADDANAYWVEDRNVAPVGDNLIAFDRIFAQVPQDRTEGAPNYAFTFPSTGATGSNKNVSIINGTGDFLTYNGRVETKFTLTSANAADVAIGDKFKVSLGGSRVVFYGMTTGYVDTKGFYVIYEKVPSGSNYVYRAYLESWQAVDTVISHSTFSSFSITSPVTLNGTVDEQRTIESDSLLVYRYLKTDDILSEKTESAFQVLSESTTFTLQETVTSSTYPSVNEYKGLVYVGGFIQGEAESPRRWMGNIWEFVSRKVRAK